MIIQEKTKQASQKFIGIQWTDENIDTFTSLLRNTMGIVGGWNSPSIFESPLRKNINLLTRLGDLVRFILEQPFSFFSSRAKELCFYYASKLRKANIMAARR